MIYCDAEAKLIATQWARDNPKHEFSAWILDQIARLAPSPFDLMVADIRASRPRTAMIVDLAYYRSRQFGVAVC
jgi:hypothetical protein